MFRKERGLEPPEDDSAKIEERVAELMKDEYCPYQHGHFAEAISEANEKDSAIINEMLQRPNVDMDYEALGRKLCMMAFEYMEAFAISQAESELEQGLL